MNRELIRRIVRSGLKADRQALASAVKQLASSESKQGHKAFAEELRSMVQQSPLDPEVQPYPTAVNGTELERSITVSPPRSKGEARANSGVGPRAGSHRDLSQCRI